MLGEREVNKITLDESISVNNVITQKDNEIDKLKRYLKTMLDMHSHHMTKAMRNKIAKACKERALVTPAPKF